MGERAWTFVGAIMMTVVISVGTLLYLVMFALSAYVIVAGAEDIWSAYNKGEAAWVRVALLLIFVWTFFNSRRVTKIEGHIEHLKMLGFATASYFDFTYGNERLDPLKGLGPLTKHGFWRLWCRMTGRGVLADDFLNASFASRYGRKVTLADDLRSAWPHPQ
jgi:hypothetical protein